MVVTLPSSWMVVSSSLKPTVLRVLAGGEGCMTGVCNEGDDVDRLAMLSCDDEEEAEEVDFGSPPLLLCVPTSTLI